MIAFVNQTGKSIRSSPSIGRLLCSILVLSFTLIVSESLQDEITNTNNVSLNNNQEVVKIGNSKTNNYNYHERSYRPTQLTQVVLNVPKLSPDKLRKSRPPTIQEFEIKQRILDIYNRVKRDIKGQSDELDHLGRIIQALNPKYIATERVRLVTFSNDPQDLVPLPYAAPINGPAPVETLKLLGADSDIPDQLSALADKFKSIVSWDDQFVDSLAATPDETLDSSQITFKRVILCIARPDQCNSQVNQNQFFGQQQPPQQAQPRGTQPIEFSPQQLENYNNFEEQQQFIGQGLSPQEQDEQGYQPYEVQQQQPVYEYEPQSQASEQVVERVPYQPPQQQQLPVYNQRLPAYGQQQNDQQFDRRPDFGQVRQLAKTYGNQARRPEQQQQQQVPQWQAALANKDLVNKLKERYVMSPNTQQVSAQQPLARNQQKFAVRPRWASQERLQQERRQ